MVIFMGTYVALLRFLLWLLFCDDHLILGATNAFCPLYLERPSIFVHTVCFLRSTKSYKSYCTLLHMYNICSLLVARSFLVDHVKVIATL